jgi:RHH-type proline utilization regulon transcriptional repressor/proline dehydrogenase/delta 1-pyrroline-5-carboxylate dehydrogenase
MSQPFAAFADDLPPLDPARARIADLHRKPEAECIAALLPDARMTPQERARAEALAHRLIVALRAKRSRGLVQGLVREYDLSSQEGVALMCLAEALLRIPDQPTRDKLIRDKIGTGDWRAHLGQSSSPFVNAATWGLVVTGKLVSPVDEGGLSAALTRLIGRGGEPLVRKGVDLAIRLMGEQFVAGQNIQEALRHAARQEARGFRYSYDMLGEAALTAADAERYFRDYETAIHAIGAAARGQGVAERPGISIKLSALHPRYVRAQRRRVLEELVPRAKTLAALARRYDIGLNIDAEEADRLDLSLDVLEALCRDPALAGWQGIGFVVQAYQKRAPAVIDWIVQLARDTQHRIMLRLVKGAYWDSEIKRAHQDGLEDFPVFTRKRHTDVSYLACARQLLAAPDAVFPQFATHNAHTVAAIYVMAGDDFVLGQYEFQCLHGMGEPLYAEVVGASGLGRPARIYAPVGTHETLLAYLVRRLLENGANSSFVNRIQDEAVPAEHLAADPVAHVDAMPEPGAPHPQIRLPPALLPGRASAAGLDLSSEATLRGLAAILVESGARHWQAGHEGTPRDIRNPADHTDLVGRVHEATATQIDRALAHAEHGAPSWAATPAPERARILLAAADAMQAAMPSLLGLIVREAGKSLANAVSEVREAVDFLRYYAGQVGCGFDNSTHVPLGPVACISPWNFPLAIFTGQVAAALAAGCAVLAKPAEETPLIAAEAVRILHAAGVPQDALLLLPGDGAVGARLVADARVRGVLFTGSTQAARSIQRTLAQRLNPGAVPVPLIAETGGLNALVVDSSALAEQVVTDVLVSAFDSAGQRCSALRVLCLQQEVADRILTMLKGAVAELRVGNPDRLETDVGPVISRQARQAITDHVAAMRAAGRSVHEAALAPECARGHFVPPTIIEIDSLADVQHEVFGPVLHVLRYPAGALDAVVAAVNATGHGLTFGVHTRIGDTVARVTASASAGNIYVNRNLIGAVVGVQPFGGHGLSGTGPKAGGPLYLRRLLAHCPPAALPQGDQVLPGPAGEDNLYRLAPRGTVLCVAEQPAALAGQVAACAASGNRALLACGVRADLPPELARAVAADGEPDAALFAGGHAGLLALCQSLAARDGPIVPVHVARPDGSWPLEWLLREQSVSINTAAAGGNASLMALEDA